VSASVCIAGQLGGLYTPPQIPGGLQVDSRRTPGQYLESTWNLDTFFLVASQPIFCLESIWSPGGLQVDSSCLHLDNMDSTSEHREI
jgi:hypothetical protein